MFSGRYKGKTEGWRDDCAGNDRIDYRLSDEGQLYFLEANPNPELANYEELASAAAEIGINYQMLIQRILNLGLRR